MRLRRCDAQKWHRDKLEAQRETTTSNASSFFPQAGQMACVAKFCYANYLKLHKERPYPGHFGRWRLDNGTSRSHVRMMNARSVQPPNTAGPPGRAEPENYETNPILARARAALAGRRV